MELNMNSSTSTNESQTGITETITRIFQQGCLIVSQMIAISALEVRLAGLSLVMIIGAGVGIVLLMFCAWLMLLAMVGYFLIAAGYGYGLALLILAAINLISILPLVYIINSFLKNLSFSKTREQTKNIALIGK